MKKSNQVSSKGKGNSGNKDNKHKNVKDKNKKQDTKDKKNIKENDTTANKQIPDSKKNDTNSKEEKQKEESNKELVNNQNNNEIINNKEKMEPNDIKNKGNDNPSTNDKKIGESAQEISNSKPNSDGKNTSKQTTTSYGNQTSSKSYGSTNSYGYSSSSGSYGYSGNYGNYGYSSSYGYDNYYSSYKEKIPGIFGFHNNKIINNCFMNSSLQNLLHCENFADRIHSIPDNKLSDKPLAKEIKNLITEINNGETELDPRKVKSILSTVEEKYKYNEQNDANEFITIFLNQLLKELNGVSANEYVTEKIPSDELEMKSFYKLEDRFFLKNKSFLLNLFYGRLKREYICTKNHIVSIKFNNFNTLILPHPEQSNDLIDLLILYQKGKLINDTVFCEACQKECQYYITTKIYNIPKYFIVCLEKESAYHSAGIEFPKILQTEKFMKNGYGNETYYLNSFIEYSGNRKSGHYTAKVCQNKKWYSISDSYYHGIDESEIYNKSAIILFYTRFG